MDEHNNNKLGQDKNDLQRRHPELVAAEPLSQAAFVYENESALKSDNGGVRERIRQFKQSQNVVELQNAGESKNAGEPHKNSAHLRQLQDSRKNELNSYRAELGSAGKEEQMPKFPRIGIGMLVVSLTTLGLRLVSSQEAIGQLITHLPMQLFWTCCLFRLVQISDRIYGTSTSPGKIALLSIVTYLFSPMFPAPAFINRWLDPSFLIWAATQFVAPWIVGSKIDKNNPKGLSQNRFSLTLMGNWYLLFGLGIPIIVNAEALFNFFWLLCQFMWLITANQILQAQIAAKSSDLEITDDKKGIKERAFVSGENLELRYRTFAAVERWMAQRFKAEGMKQGLKQFLMWVLGPVIVIAGVIITKFVFFSDQGFGFGLNPLSHSVQTGAASSGSVQVYMLGFVCFVLGLIAITLMVYRSNPTHLLLSSRGLRFAWKHKLSKAKIGALNAWDEITHISIERPKGQTSTLHDALVFEHGTAGRLRIKLEALDSFEDKEWILKAIKAWAPQISRDASVLQSLQPPADYSYTELWLQALSAPPQRERLKPLVSGIKLKQGKYLVKNSLGVGGQGQAYLASDALSGQTLVLKEFILPVFVDISIRKSALEQFENEARILRKLDHPQIVKLIDYFVEDHRAYLVLEHIDGASLRTLVEKQGALPEPQVRALAEQMCKILAYLHNLAPPVVHRDFTPDNLILNLDGTLKLIDFNVAQQQESTTSGTVVGKHAYLPPEQFRGMPNSQSDIYALGATLFYLLTGNDPEPISMAHPKKTNANVSAAMDKLVAKATALNLPDRYLRIENLHDEL